LKKIIYLLIFIPNILYSQNINHWETIVFDNDTWKYFEGIYEPDTNWRTLTFNDSAWSSGVGGIGYGDGDDNTIISSTISLYIRNTFFVLDTSEIVAAVLDIDYDDAFVAYLNNVEIARANIGNIGDHPTYNQNSNSLHEAQMYQGGLPDRFVINNQIFRDNIVPGNNVLSIQIHNDNINSSDLTGRAFLSFAIDNSNTNYSPTPNWFQPPLIFTSSNLPIVVINTNNQNIVDDPRIICDMGIIDNGIGMLNSINDSFNNYDGKISIEYRGSSSQSFPKKAYALETQDSIGNNNNVSLLGMPVENDWILYAPYSDKSLMRNVLTFNLGRKMNRYTPRTRYCELIINGNYRGVYVLMEKIKRDNDRVDIAKLDFDDNAGDSLTGGYIVKIDKYTGTGGSDWLSDFPDIGGGGLYIQYHYPEASNMSIQQLDYIEHFIDSFEYALDGPNFSDTLIGYSKYIDVESFIDLYIINELSRNVDGYRLSTYMYKDRDSNGGKLTMGPFWDYNLAFGNVNYCSGDQTSGWQVDGACPDLGNNPFWFERLLEDTIYVNKLKCRWEYLRMRSFHEDSIRNYIDSVTSYINDAQNRNFQRWNILGNYVWPNSYVGNTYQDEVNFLKDWISNRILWMDNNLLGTCYEILGCTDPLACNYDLIANTDDGSCIYSSTSYDTLVSNTSVFWNGMHLLVSGDYTLTLINSVGCDSIANINFTLIPTATLDYNEVNKDDFIITDVLGRKTNYKQNTIQFYLYQNGIVEKKIVFKSGSSY